VFLLRKFMPIKLNRHAGKNTKRQGTAFLVQRGFVVVSYDNERKEQKRIVHAALTEQEAEIAARKLAAGEQVEEIDE
jgi:hypothetical protein